MDPGVAQQIAYISHAGQHTRFGDPVIEHLERVAQAVPSDASAVAWLHDLFELTSLSHERLWPYGLTADEALTLRLLTRLPSESYEAYIRRIALAPGRPGELARTVKLADLDDHLGHAWTPPGAPPYAWARRCVCEQRDLESSPRFVA
jgi:hypothetical protein